MTKHLNFVLRSMQKSILFCLLTQFFGYSKEVSKETFQCPKFSKQQFKSIVSLPAGSSYSEKMIYFQPQSSATHGLDQKIDQDYSWLTHFSEGKTFNDFVQKINALDPRSPLRVSFNNFIEEIKKLSNKSIKLPLNEKVPPLIVNKSVYRQSLNSSFALAYKIATISYYNNAYKISDTREIFDAQFYPCISFSKSKDGPNKGDFFPGIDFDYPTYLSTDILKLHPSYEGRVLMNTDLKTKYLHRQIKSEEWFKEDQKQCLIAPPYRMKRKKDEKRIRIDRLTAPFIKDYRNIDYNIKGFCVYSYDATRNYILKKKENLKDHFIVAIIEAPANENITNEQKKQNEKRYESLGYLDTVLVGSSDGK